MAGVEDEICMEHLYVQCSKFCDQLHRDTNYQWQTRAPSSDSWEDLSVSNNRKIETAFCAMQDVAILHIRRRVFACLFTWKEMYPEDDNLNVYEGVYEVY